MPYWHIAIHDPNVQSNQPVVGVARWPSSMHHLIANCIQCLLYSTTTIGIMAGFCNITDSIYKLHVVRIIWIICLTSGISIISTTAHPKQPTHQANWTTSFLLASLRALFGKPAVPVALKRQWFLVPWSPPKVISCQSFLRTYAALQPRSKAATFCTTASTPMAAALCFTISDEASTLVIRQFIQQICSPRELTPQYVPRNQSPR